MSDAMPNPVWNQTERVYPGTLVHDAVVAQVARTPSAPAVRFRDEMLTYAELDERVGRLAVHLGELGVAPGSLVGVCMYNSVELVVALHAIARAGGGYVPVDPEYPDERIGFILDDLDSPLVLTQERLIARLKDAGARLVAIDRQPATAWVSAASDPPHVSPDDPFYVIYTSGSTGRPKGVVITHGNISNRMSWLQEHFGLTPADKVLQKTPFSFDPSVWQFFWPLTVGAQIVVGEPAGHRDSTYLAQTIIEHGITTIHFVPSMLQLFLEEPLASDCVSLKRVICSGEVLARPMQDRFFDRLHAELHNLYGPSEVIGVTAWRCDPRSDLSFVPIGKPVANTQLHILDEEMRPVPVGTAGELYIGGAQVGRGYLNRPGLTAERFVADPLRDGGRLYRSGDLARYLPDGNLEFLGRTDFQVKIRGNRVELGEIEAVLESFDGVRGAVVVAHDPTGEELELAAYVAHPDGDRLPVDEIRANLASRLPDYMIPTTFVTLERFPLNANGKVDRKALPPPVRVRPQLDRSYAAPRSELQRIIAGRWRRGMNLDRVGIHDRFFELGGTSLQAARFVIGLQAELGVSLPVTTLFNAPSVAEYAAFLERAHPAAVARYLGQEGAAAVGEPGQSDVTPDGPHARHRARRSLSQQRARRVAGRSPEPGALDLLDG
jgi:amino acid adenylation domain-containing protein